MSASQDAGNRLLTNTSDGYSLFTGPLQPKVGWETYDNEAEAKARSKTAFAEAVQQAARGYDFGYCSPGQVVQGRRDGELVEEWTVTTA